MDTIQKKEKINMKVKLSTLWIVVMFTMIFADILSFMTPGFMKQIIDGTTGTQVTQELLLVFAILLEIPIMMIFLSRTLKYKTNRLANIVAALITALFVIGGGSTYLHYIFFATVEIVCMLLIILNAWKWQDSENSNNN
jgi:Sec-independent protein secretion pathway component TatC